MNDAIDVAIAAPPTKRRRKKGKSPTARTLAECRRRGWIAQVVEQTIPRVFIKRDLFGCIDIVAIDPGDAFTPPRIIGIQATSGDNHASRRTKILEEKRARAWIAAGAGLEVWSWAQRGAAGKRKLWTLRTEAITADMFITTTEGATAA